MMTGQAPFEGANPYMIMNARLGGDPIAPRKINRALSPQVEEIILHALEENPANRYQSALEMKAELDNPTSVHLTGRHERLRPPAVGKNRGSQTHLVVIAILAPFAIFGLLALGFFLASVTR
jgi:serine/threonine protein kinase